MPEYDALPPLDTPSLRAEVAGPGRHWRQLDVVEQTGSTNADLLARAAAGEDIAGAVLIAEHQTAGRGRNGRVWTSPGAQLTMSVGVDGGGVPPDSWGWLPLATGVAVVDTVAPYGVAAGLKWPNDVLVGDRKLAGILTEVAAAQRFIVVGIGLNVTLRGDEVPDADATSLRALGVETLDRGQLVAALLRELGTRFSRWREADGADAGLIADYRARSVTIGSRVRAILPGGGEVLGVAQSIDEQGRLHIDSDAGTVAVSAGDVVHLR
ncbi:BirA family biotin operon repressor/biotin-[acetyl-CoA-carboxylase] ligase [Mycobacterium sp. OAS707]|uniref:biotin--[acetyl-CoA-carboxylase] ligase n=1 Tax=Mycobacterium sp. OAS707 TaxID=2663822 RepID=UPI00178B3C6C|nr:biotin--[acetyl-CoA-carboxylase] ligase [Mycobacterium sp. OAS707]MBE1547469.1 BirA family biotin operon repressor/biotin-[acetyl-CoA-carboxylase] ligase [Mycobacterium sp. OAS707]